MRLAVGLILLNTRFFMQWRADEWFNRRPRSNIATTNSFGARASLSVGEREYEIYKLDVLRAAGPRCATPHLLAADFFWRICSATRMA
jgi:hypothetical protein